jgi:hypothetical protein
MAGSKPGRPRTNGPRCGAKTPNGPCRNAAGERTPTPGVAGVPCYRHGGSTQTHQVHARHLVAADAAAQFGTPIETTPEEALMDALAHAAGQVAFYRARVAELTRDQMTYGAERITRTQRLPGGGQQTTEDVTVAKSRPHVWIVLLNEAQRHYAEVAKACAVLNIEQRRVAMAEEHGSFIYETLSRVLAHYGHRDDPLLPVVLGEVMAELTNDQ